MENKLAAELQICNRIIIDIYARTSIYLNGKLPCDSYCQAIAFRFLLGGNIDNGVFPIQVCDNISKTISVYPTKNQGYK